MANIFKNAKLDLTTTDVTTKKTPKCLPIKPKTMLNQFCDLVHRCDQPKTVDELRVASKQKACNIRNIPFL